MILQTQQDVIEHVQLLASQGIVSSWNGYNLWIHSEVSGKQRDFLQVMGARYAESRARKNDNDGKNRPVYYFHAVEGLPKYIEGLA